MKNTNKSTWFRTIKKLGNASGDTSSTYEILDHTDKPDEVICEEIADYFSAISQEYTPLNKNLLPPNLNHIQFPTNAPIIEEYQIYGMIKNSKLSGSLLPGDIPHKILKEFAVELSVPITNIFNTAIQQGVYPSTYKKEMQVPIPKISPPNDYNELRNLSCTMFFSKKLEQIMLEHMLKHTRPFIDPTHYGGFKGSSITHYLITLLDFALKKLENPEITAILMCLVDWSKAFNRMNHNITIQRLIEYQVPEWLVKLTVSYLEKRSMQVRFKGHISKSRSLPGSSPQGTLLGLLLFIITSNETCMTFKPLPESVTDRTTMNLVKEDDQDNLCRAKFVDDVTTAEAVHINKLTIKPYCSMIGPLPFQDSSNFELSPEVSLLQKEIIKAKNVSYDLEMKINADKTKIFVVNFSKNHQFIPRFRVPGTPCDLEVVASTNDLKFHEHVQNLVKKGNNKLWMLRHLKQFSISLNDLIEIYTIFIRSCLEYCVPVWNPSLTVENKGDIERIQKNSFENFSWGIL